MPALVLFAFRLLAGGLPLVVALLLILGQTLLQHLLELLVLFRQLLRLTLQRIAPAARFGTVPALESRPHGLHGRPEAVANRSGFGGVIGVAPSVELELVSTQADGIVQDGRRGRSLECLG